MIEFAVKNAWLVPMLPLLAAIIITFFTRNNPILSSRISRLAIFAALIQSIIIGYQANIDIEYVMQNSQGVLKWFETGDKTISISWKVDAVTSMMLFVVTFISTLVQLYSREYMEEYMNKGFARYFAELSLFSFSMLILVMTDNFLVLYAGWELVGVSSFLLIGFFYEKKSAAKAAKKAFITNRVGDFGFLIGILILFTHTGSLNFDVVAQGIADGKLTGTLLTFSAILLFFGAIGKSGQFPLHVWLPDAMEGPTPVSALIHAATMVTAGVYMVAKVMTIFAQATMPVLWGINALQLVGLVGGITAIMAAFIAITQTDIKKVLAYSTVSQLGFMILALGMFTTPEGTVHPLGYTAALFHLFTHAFFKAMLFLGSGSVIHACHTQDIREMGGLRKMMPTTAITFLIGTAAISGFPLTAGFWSKDEILAAAYEGNMALFIVAAIAAVFTAFYMFRLYFLTFEGKYRGHGKPHEPGIRMRFPLMLLAVPSLFVGFIGTPWNNIFHHFIHYTPVGSHGHHEIATHEPNFMLMGLSVLIFATGFIAALSIYGKGLEKSEKIAKALGPIYNLSYNKLYFDEIYQGFVNFVILLSAKIASIFDQFVIDAIVDGFGYVYVLFSHIIKRLQSGKVQQYGVYILAAILIIFTLITLPFKTVESVQSVFNKNFTIIISSVIVSLTTLIVFCGLYIKGKVFD